MTERFPKRVGCFGNNFPSELCFARPIKRTSSMHRRKNKWHKLDWWMIDRSLPANKFEIELFLNFYPDTLPWNRRKCRHSKSSKSRWSAVTNNEQWKHLKGRICYSLFFDVKLKTLTDNQIFWALNIIVLNNWRSYMLLRSGHSTCTYSLSLTSLHRGTFSKLCV